VNPSGWIGTNGQMHFVMDSFGAEKDETGRFLIAGELPATFLGLEGETAEVVVSARVLCRVNGRWTSVAHLYQQTSYGLKVEVI